MEPAPGRTIESFWPVSTWQRGGKAQIRQAALRPQSAAVLTAATWHGSYPAEHSEDLAVSSPPPPRAGCPANPEGGSRQLRTASPHSLTPPRHADRQATSTARETVRNRYRRRPGRGAPMTSPGASAPPPAALPRVGLGIGRGGRGRCALADVMRLGPPCAAFKPAWRQSGAAGAERGAGGCGTAGSRRRREDLGAAAAAGSSVGWAVRR